jgi:filamentous hemagglutinin
VAAGAVASRALAAALGGAPKTFMTDRGRRFVDVFVKGTAYEVKTGYQNIRTLLENQIAKDVWLRDNGYVQAVEWVFYKSPVTGRAGPGPALRDALYQARIPWVFK